MGYQQVCKQDVLNLIDLGLIVLPAYRYEKRPCVKWRHLLAGERPSKEYLAGLVENFNTGRWCLLTGQNSNVTVIDFDVPLNSEYLPEDASFVETPSGGRHYFIEWQSWHRRGIGVKENIDIPHVVMLYDAEVPVYIHPPSPLTDIVRSIPEHRSEVPRQPFTPKPISMNALEDNCAFIKYYMEKRHDPRWDGRYPLARAYASNVNLAVDAHDDDLRLGPAYQHQADIYAKVSFPLTCRYIYNHWKCPHFHEGTGTCSKAAGITTPYGLAGRNS
jgi:hypothetical protein